MYKMVTHEDVNNNLYATMLKHSISEAGVHLYTFEVQFWRGVLAELNTHNMLSKNAASSRAIPFDKMLLQLGGSPVRFGSKNKGMQDTGVEMYVEGGADQVPEGEIPLHKQKWQQAKQEAISNARWYYDNGYHKQVYNRLVEPFQLVKAVITATDIQNFLWLRDDDHADPSIAALSRLMRKCIEDSKPQLLHEGEWHLPYVNSERDGDGNMCYYITQSGEREYLTLDNAKQVSSARCAAVSFRNTDYTLEKSNEVVDRLVNGDKLHASAFEHQATPCNMKAAECIADEGDIVLPSGIDIIRFMPDKQFYLYSGQLRQWIQYRKLLPRENYELINS